MKRIFHRVTLRVCRRRPSRRFGRWPGLAAILLVLAAVPANAQMVPTGPDVFGSQGLRAENIAPFPKWAGALQRAFRERQAALERCESGLFTSCPIQDWAAFLRTVSHLPPERKMREVNAFLNRTRYITDMVNWNIDDYWASPHQFLSRDGDCEDYAIAKFLSLRALGFSNGQMRIVVLNDLNLRVAHAILVVELGGRRYVLDNQIRDAVPADIIRHYQPIFSLNETHWWLHRPA